MGKTRGRGNFWGYSLTSNLKKELLRQIKDEEIWYCPRLFDHIYTNVDGDYSVCCIGGPTNISSSKVTPTEWYTSDEINDLRYEMLSPSKSSATEIKNIHCYRCINQEKNYGLSERQKFIQNIDLEDTVLDQTIQFVNDGEYKFQERILMVQVRIFGNQCNLDCYMCHPRNSSTRTKQTEKFGYQTMLDWDPPYPKNMRYDATIENLLSLIPYIRTIVVQGGEPMVMKKQFEFLDAIVKSGHAHKISIECNTNGTKLHYDGHNLLNYIRKFKHTWMNISLDGYGKYNDYIRRRSKWDEIEFNVNKLKEVYQKISVSVFTTVSLLSVLRLYELQKWCNDNGFRQSLFIVDDPKELHPCHLPARIKNNLIPKYQDYPVIRKALEMKGNEIYFNRAMDYIEVTDRAYNYAMDVIDLYPELDPEFYGEWNERTIS